MHLWMAGAHPGRLRQRHVVFPRSSAQAWDAAGRERMTNASPVIPPFKQQQITDTLEDDAQVMSNTQLEQELGHERPAVQKEVLSINTRATNLALQVALLVPILAGLLGLFNSFRMMRLPDIEPLDSIEAAALA